MSQTQQLYTSVGSPEGNVTAAPGNICVTSDGSVYFKGQGNGATGWVLLTPAESDIASLVSDLALKAPLASPALTGTPTVPTAAIDTNTTQAASAAFVLGQAASANPIVDGTAAPGTSTRYARADHVHPGVIDVGAFFPGAPGNSAILARVPVTRAIVFPVALAGSKGVLGTAATASTVFSIQKNGVEFGTCTFDISGTVGTFASVAGASFAAGDVLSIIAPASADATAADIGITLAGTKS